MLEAKIALLLHEFQFVTINSLVPKINQLLEMIEQFDQEARKEDEGKRKREFAVKIVKAEKMANRLEKYSQVTLFKRMADLSDFPKATFRDLINDQFRCAEVANVLADRFYP